MQRLASGARLEFFDTLDSTSAEARRRIAAGEDGPLWILAHEQTAGVGRRGRAWVTGQGNFAGTYLFEPDGDIATFGQLSFVVAIAVLDALDVHVRPGSLALKWPNDILAGADKLAGILLETTRRNDRIWVSAGIGVNIHFAPTGLPYRAARLVDMLASGASAPSPQTLAAQIDDRLAAHYALWRRDGFAAIRTPWLERAKGLGARVKVTLPNETVTGVFHDLDESGALVVGVGDGERHITVGEIMFGD